MLTLNIDGESGGSVITICSDKNFALKVMKDSAYDNGWEIDEKYHVIGFHMHYELSSYEINKIYPFL